MPTEKRARQRAAREAKLAAQAKVDRRRRLLRNGGWTVVALAVVGGIAYLSFGGSTPAKKATTATTTTASVPATTSTSTTVASSTTSTVAPTTTTSTVSSADAAAQTAANAAAVAAGCPASPTARANTQSYKSAPPMTIDTSATYTAAVKTTAGNFTVVLDAKQAPVTVNSFVFLAQQNYFHCVIFHRVIPGFMDQTGDPTGTGTGGPGYTFANENVPKSYATGEVAMANTGQADSNGSQFFVVVPGGAATLDGDLSSGGYSLFGTVTEGLNVVEQINAQGTSAGTPSVIQRILSVTITKS